MKTFIAVLAFCCVGVLASTKEQRAEYLSTCINKHKVETEAIIATLKRKIDVPNKEVGLYFACMLKISGVMKPDRTFNMEAGHNLYSSEAPKDKATITFERCKPVITNETTDSEAAIELLQCVYNTPPF